MIYRHSETPQTGRRRAVYTEQQRGAGWGGVGSHECATGALDL